MTVLYNPALYEEPRNQPMKAVSLIPRKSLFSWIESTGRFRAIEIDELQNHKISEDLDDILEPEIDLQEDEDEEQD